MGFFAREQIAISRAKDVLSYFDSSKWMGLGTYELWKPTAKRPDGANRAGRAKDARDHPAQL
jgi:hypothetical protein